MRRAAAGCVLAWTACALIAAAPAQQGATKTWKAVPFAIVRYNDDAPKSWNLYHSDKRGILLLRLWKRYLLLNVPAQEIYDIDPQKVKVSGDSAQLSEADIPDDPVETSEWKTRDAGPVQRIRFRFGSEGNFLEIQIPMRADGRPSY